MHLIILAIWYHLCVFTLGLFESLRPEKSKWPLNNAIFKNNPSSHINHLLEFFATVWSMDGGSTIKNV